MRPTFSRPVCFSAMVYVWVAFFPAQNTLAVPGAQESPDTLVKQGEYLVNATGGCGCHTVPAGESSPQGAYLAGGRPVHTPFGIYYSTNITPDEATGLGRWREADFIRAMTEGIAPDGSHYFPAFPYTSFTKILPDDLRAMWAYLRSVPPVRQDNRPHDVWPPFNWRWPLGVWKWLNFRQGVFQPDAAKSPEQNRGGYLVQALAHCGECHSPRSLDGGIKTGRILTGGEHLSPEPVPAANLTPHEETGLGRWSRADMTWLLQTGFRPNGNDVQGVMLELIEKGYTRLAPTDLDAIGAYLFSLPAKAGVSPNREE